MMESAPSTEAVYEGVYTLYNNENAAEKEKASKWLEQLQNSVNTYMVRSMNERMSECTQKHNHTFSCE